MPELKTEDLARLFKASEEETCLYCRELIDAVDLGYRQVEGAELQDLLLEIIKRIDSPDLVASGAHRESSWESGWRQNLEEFKEGKGDLRSLIPKYYFKHKALRYHGGYVAPNENDFFYNITEIFRTWIFRKYLGEFPCIYEFGCGTGHHLVRLASLFPEKQLVGLDWTRTSQELLTTVAESRNLRIRARNFNFFKPDDSLVLEPGSAVFTFGALEQIGPSHDQFLDFILSQKPELCINIEGIHEFYDLNQLSDYLAFKYHKKREYLDGYYKRLVELESAGRIQVLSSHHQQVGNLWDDSHSYIIWKPVS